MQHHFVVYFDDVTKTWNVDTETTEAKFDGDNRWNNASGQWLEWSDDTSNALNKLFDVFIDANKENK